jgi:hypothetical protein
VRVVAAPPRAAAVPAELRGAVPEHRTSARSGARSRRTPGRRRTRTR